VRDIPPAYLMMGDGVHDSIDSAFAPFDLGVSYELNAYCNDPRAMGRLYTAMHQNVLDIFSEHGVQIMTPAYEGNPAGENAYRFPFQSKEFSSQYQDNPHSTFFSV
jgi:hypothetical protein